MKRPSSQSGAALLTAMFVMVVVTFLALSAARTALDAEKTARNERDRHIAFQSAEAGLADAERDIAGGADPGSARAALFANADPSAFVEGCDGAGLCKFMAAPEVPAWQTVDLADPAIAVAYGTFTGAALSGRPPRYIVELAPASSHGPGHLYRITAMGFGRRANTQVVLQSIYRKTGAVHLRVSWREVANWRELHDATK